VAHIRQEFGLGHVGRLGAHVGRHQRLLALAALRDVADEGAEFVVFAIGQLHPRDRQLDREFGAVAAQRIGLDAAVQHPADAAALEARQAVAVGGAVALGHDALVEVEAQHLVARPAEDLLGLRVPADDAALAVHPHHGVEGGVDDRLQLFLAVARHPDRVQQLARARRDLLFEVFVQLAQLLLDPALLAQQAVGHLLGVPQPVQGIAEAAHRRRQAPDLVAPADAGQVDVGLAARQLLECFLDVGEGLGHAPADQQHAGDDGQGQQQVGHHGLHHLAAQVFVDLAAREGQLDAADVVVAAAVVETDLALRRGSRSARRRRRRARPAPRRSAPARAASGLRAWRRANRPPRTRPRC
jgi:hypothetical protein